MSRQAPLSRTAVVVTALAIALSLMVTGAMAQAARPSAVVRILVDPGIEQQARRFLAGVQERLPVDIRPRVTFTTVVPAAVDLRAALGRSDWEMAILSTAVLAGLSTRSPATAFEIPFLFKSVTQAIELQNSPIGLAGLGTLDELGMTGLAYVNGGIARVASVRPTQSAGDLKGLKVGVVTAGQEATLRTFGSSTVRVPSDQLPPAMTAGQIDAAVIGPADTARFDAHRFVLDDGVRAQVAVAVTRDQTWDAIPFAIRHTIGEAAVATARALDRGMVETEATWRRQVGAGSVQILSLPADEATRAARQWIDAQPIALRDHYSGILDDVKKAPAPPRTTPERRGQAGTVYFATTRGEEAGEPLTRRFSDGRTGDVRCGQIDFTAADQVETARVSGAATLGSDACIRRLRTALAGTPRVLLYVHGFNNSFADALQRAMFLRQNVPASVAVVMWSWPARVNGNGSNYGYDKDSATGIAQSLFKNVLSGLAAAPAPHISLLAHSMGAWHVQGALNNLDTGSLRLGHITFAAPDMPVSEFNLGLDRLRATHARLSLYACDWDYALILSKRVHDKDPRAGTGGPSDIVVARDLESIDVPSTWFASGSWSFSNNHSYVFEAGKVLDDFRSLLVQDTPPAARGLVQTPKVPWHYWAFP